MPGDIREDRRQRADAQSGMARDGEMVSANERGREPQVRATLPGDDIPESSERPRQLISRDVARELHRARTSSRTKWRRTREGRESAS